MKHPVIVSKLTRKMLTFGITYLCASSLTLICNNSFNHSPYRRAQKKTKLDYISTKIPRAVVHKNNWKNLA